MVRPYILRKDVSTLGDLADGYKVGAILPPWHGNVFWVDGGWANPGSDGDDGSKENPFLTITYALTKCANYNWDFIIVRDYYQPSGETWPISVNKQGVSIIGASSLGMQPSYCELTSEGAYDCFSFDTNSGYSTLAGFSMVAGASDACIIAGTSGIHGVVIDNCLFGVAGASVDGILLPNNTGWHNSIIRNCVFGSALTGDGIETVNVSSAGGFTECSVVNNRFLGVGGVCIKATGYWVGGEITHNKFGLPADTAGDSITMSSVCSEVFISGNVTAEDKTPMTNNPYKDSGNCEWGLNYKGITAMMPAIA